VSVIVFAQVKGGSGKTTSICALAPAFRAVGLSVSVIDADPQQSVSRWHRRYAAHVSTSASNDSEGITLFPNVGETTLIDTIDAAAGQSDIVLIDLQGSANQAMLYAITRADLVIVPCQPGEFDVAEAVRTLSVVQQTAKAMRREIPARVLMTRTSPSLKRKADSHGRKQLEKAGAAVLDTELQERTFFAQLTYTGAPPDAAEPSEQNVLININGLLREVVSMLKGA